MADVVQEKSRGLKFAERQLLRHGWEHGKGLGRAEDGIAEAIKVKVKCDKGGVGHKEGEQFTFHWWDHVFNKASSSLQVESDENGIILRKTTEDAEADGMISNKKPRKATLAKDKLYGCFVKSTTLLSGQEQPAPRSSTSEDSSSSDEEDQKLDLSSTTNLSDADLMKACGGRTAHKGARHGLTMSAKLARLEQQEAEFMAKYGKKSQPASDSPACGSSADQSEERQAESRQKANKRPAFSIQVNGDAGSESHEPDVKRKTKKKKRAVEDREEKAVVLGEEEVVRVERSEEDLCQKTKKHKKKKHKTEQNKEERAPSPERPAERHADTKVKKKKKKSCPSEEREIYDESECRSSEPVQDCDSKKAATVLEEAEVTEEELTVQKQKRKKCKKDKASISDNANKEALRPKKKKKKSKE